MGCFTCCFKSACDCLSKGLLMGLNGFFMMQGLTMTIAMTIAIVIISALVPENAEELEWITTVKTIIIIILSFGSTILFVSFLGCCGACMKNHCMLNTYAAVLMLLIIGQIVMVVMAATWRQDTEDQVQEEWMASLKNYSIANDHPRKDIDEIQISLECCGVKSLEDWKQNDELAETFSIPNSCCKNATVYPDCGSGYFNHTDTYQIYTTGCYNEARDDLMIWFQIVWYFILTIICVQASLVVAACCLSSKKKKKPKIIVIQ